MKNTEDKIYTFVELPEQVQKDFIIQFIDDFDFDPSNYNFLLKVIPYNLLLEELDMIYGPNFIDEIEDNYIIELASDILNNGLEYPPIGSEGIHRSLAHIMLKRDMPRFKIISNNLE